MFSNEQNLKINISESIFLSKNINLLSHQYFLMKLTLLTLQVDWRNYGNVWTFSLCAPFHLRSPLPPAPVCLF